MEYLRPILLSLLLIITQLFVNTSSTRAQSLNSMNDSSLAMLNSLPPEQLQGLLKMAMSAMPPEQKEVMEEALKHMNATSPELVSIDIQNKNIVFIPIAHASTPEFYAAVTDSVKKYKDDGYIVYYEQIINDRQLKADDIDTVRLKFRKMMGIEPSRQTYGILKRLFPHIVPQPAYSDMGITESDINADVSLTDIVNEYERQYGYVNLNDCDYKSGFESIVYNCDKLNHDIMPIILDFRNEHVVNMILNEKYQKILIIYGAKHVPGMIDLLNR